MKTVLQQNTNALRYMQSIDKKRNDELPLPSVTSRAVLLSEPLPISSNVQQSQPSVTSGAAQQSQPSVTSASTSVTSRAAIIDVPASLASQ